MSASRGSPGGRRWAEPRGGLSGTQSKEEVARQSRAYTLQSCGTCEEGTDGSLLSLAQQISREQVSRGGTSGLGVCTRDNSVRSWQGPPLPASILLGSCRGNVKRQRPYQEGTPCSQCPSGYHCEISLCGESGMGWGERGKGGKGR